MNGGQNYYFGGSYKPNLNDYTKPGENGGSMIYGTSPAAAANPDIKWETSTQTDLGVDMRFFNQRLSFTFDYYYKKTTDMLAEMPVPTYIGQSKPWGNLGSMETGDLSLNLAGKIALKISLIGSTPTGLIPKTNSWTWATLPANRIMKARVLPV